MKKLNLQALETDLSVVNAKDAKSLLGGAYMIVMEPMPEREPVELEDQDPDDEYFDPFDHDPNHEDFRDHILPHLPTTGLEQQLNGSGACVSYSMAFVASYLDPSNHITGPMMALKVALNIGVGLNTVLNTGLTINEANQAIQSVFTTTQVNTPFDSTSGQYDISGVFTALDNNHPVLANILNIDPITLQPVGHEIVLVGYHTAEPGSGSPGYFVTYDPVTGTYESVPFPNINYNGGIWEVTGII